MTPAFASLLLALAPPAAAPSPGGEMPSPCDPATSRLMTTSEIATNAEAIDGQCVRVSGIGGYDTLFDSVEGIYLWARAGRRAGDAHTLRFDLPGVREPQALTRAAYLTVTGRLWSCSLRLAPGRSRRLPGPQACGTNPVLIADRIEWALDRSRPLERLVGDAMRARFGSLVEAPASWPRLAAVRSVAAQFLEALRARDRARLAILLDEDSAPPSERLRRMLRYLLEDSSAPFAQLAAGTEVQTAIFIDGQSPGPLDLEQSRAVICFCRTTDCRHLWPIRRGDETGRDRPYACIRWEGARPDLGEEPDSDLYSRGRLETDSSESWLTEPAETAFRR